MAHRFFIKRGDTSPALQIQLQEADGSKITDLSPDDTVEFHMENEDGDTVVDAAGVVDDAADALVSYSWDTTDTENAGTFLAEFEVSFQATGRTETFPNSSNIIVNIEEDLA